MKYLKLLYSSAIIVVQIFISEAMASEIIKPDYIDSPPYLKYSNYMMEGLIRWSVCGHTELTYGCFAGGRLGPFRRACSMMHTPSVVTGNIKQRYLYILDGGKESTDFLKLYIYSYYEKIKINDVIASFKLFKTIKLAVRGGADAECYMASNKTMIYIGSNKAFDAAIIRKNKNYQVFIELGSSPRSLVSYITADEEGRIAQGHQNGVFYEYNDDGALLGGGGGAEILLNTNNGTPLK